MRRVSQKELKKVVSTLKEILLEISSSGCQDYMNEASEYSEAFNELVNRAESLVVEMEVKYE